MHTYAHMGTFAHMHSHGYVERKRGMDMPPLGASFSTLCSSISLIELPLATRNRSSFLNGKIGCTLLLKTGPMSIPARIPTMCACAGALARARVTAHGPPPLAIAMYSPAA